MKLLRFGTRGPQVEMLQLALIRAGYNLSGVNDGLDGIFGSKTLNKVKNFQKDNGLIVDGVVGVATWKALLRYLTGFVLYRVEINDTIFRIAKKFGTTSQAIIVANPNIIPTNLPIGAIINVPISFKNGEKYITSGKISYTWELLSLIIDGLKARYPFIDRLNIGKSVLGRDIYCLRIGSGEIDVMYNAAHHANEWITTPVVLKYLEKLAEAYVYGGSIGGYSANEIIEKSNIYFVPMVNPDGVDLVNGYFDEDSSIYRNAKKLADNYIDIPFPSGWKANISGVDLNLNYPAGWDEAREIKFSQGYTMPGPRDYVGAFPLSEPESSSLAEFTRNNAFALTLSYHTQGRVIFWKYLNYEPENSFEIGERLANVSGYSLEITPGESGYAGYKDWFIQDFNKPGYTIECGIGSNPLSVNQFDEIYSDNEPLMSVAAIEAYKK